MSHADGPHSGQPIRTAGTDVADADAAVVLVHGRGARADGMLQFAREFGREGLHYAAPQAQRGTWYPNSFLAPVEQNQPHLDSALAHVGRAVEHARSGGLPAEKVLLVGFSQGACLASEFVARDPQQYAGLVLLSGGLIGAEGTEFDHGGDADGLPFFLGVSDDDPHIPVSRAEETVAVFERLGADVRFDEYHGRGHGIFEEEIDYLRELVGSIGE
ncbi:phospholipase/carboxylesterase [Halobellus salinus]|uniref:Phospholipase/carboxylesterase n=1 Tax=Halobellus salinus TaxID=931585 RepID=A0A830EFM8_9EURY|nr:alpha/beta hydrolase [Halobellus salinus]GGJ05686.1 phospholipase/carboxylesterase [Halobellus salinus]SMP23729.1 phospholipase/carboxylesterase [Halobellus salinus]